jgi:integrase
VFMHEITRADVECFCADFLLGNVPPPLGREDRKPAKPRAYKPSYLRRFTNVLRRAWSDAQIRGFVKTNPWSKLRLPRIVQPDVPWVEPASVEAICDAAAPPNGERLRFIAWTGLCVGETIALRREHLDLDRGVLFVPHGKTPGRTRSVPLAPETVELLRALPIRADGFVFEPRTAESVRQRLKTACRHLGLPELTTHQLRHVYASHLAVSGSHPRDVAALLGHSDGGALALRRYARWFPPESEARSVERLRAFRAGRSGADASPGTPAPPRSRRGPGPASDATPGPSPSRPRR